MAELGPAMKPLIIALAFVLFSSFVVSEMEATRVSGETDIDTGWDTLGGLNYSLWNPNTGAAITNASVRNLVSTPLIATPAAKFYKPGGASSDKDAIKVYIVRDNWLYNPHDRDDTLRYKDFLYFRQDIGTEYLGIMFHKYRDASVSYSQFADVKDNLSRVSFMLGHKNMTVFINAPDGNFSSNLWWNNYTLYLGMGVGFENYGRMGIWTMLGKLMTLQLPDTPKAINFIIALPIWASIAFVGVILIRSWLPW